ncbi:P-loop containing nucleoside triphosphate hydrolase protein [Dunaliella salina]|uniref:P-loop containing nucleoside triphosphate hydrolase protein n=1 Tax=Dunaliella salina TaxID=3046 RepID=A0ABQ7GUI4_DUNSA|nr:P-loop containing nucleoside triphosphate hydrolase protein [Dunaliella salina]|eukprot:KAF5838245.1 P-loop containing nucleoside triphosphate hydrolase protein [Dunaliella salina]
MKGLSYFNGKIVPTGWTASRCLVPPLKQPSSLQPGTHLHSLVAGVALSHRSSNLASRQRVCLAAAAEEIVATERTASSVDSVPRGETAGAILVVDNVTIQAGDRDLLQDVSWRVLPGQRWGLVGANGAGKSTLLHALCGHRMVDAGKVVISPKAEVGYLAQALQHATRTVYEEVRSAMTHLSKIEARMDEAEQAMMEGDVEAAARMAQAQEEFALAGGWDVDKAISEVLSGLGFSAEQYDRNCSEFSGGWQMRIALAKLLLGPAGQAAVGAGTGGLMLLDEPTNHLDSAAVKWLGGFLRKSGGTVIIVSHDESLLDSACNHIMA